MAPSEVGHLEDFEEAEASPKRKLLVVGARPLDDDGLLVGGGLITGERRDGDERLDLAAAEELIAGGAAVDVESHMVEGEVLEEELLTSPAARWSWVRGLSIQETKRSPWLLLQAHSEKDCEVPHVSFREWTKTIVDIPVSAFSATMSQEMLFISLRARSPLSTMKQMNGLVSGTGWSTSLYARAQSGVTSMNSAMSS
jgi:chitodextrinase